MAVLAWFLWRRWLFKVIVNSAGRPSDNLLNGFHNLNVDGCRKHPVIYNDMCRIVEGTTISEYERLMIGTLIGCGIGAIISWVIDYL